MQIECVMDSCEPAPLSPPGRACCIARGESTPALCRIRRRLRVSPSWLGRELRPVVAMQVSTKRCSAAQSARSWASGSVRDKKRLAGNAFGASPRPFVAVPRPCCPLVVACTCPVLNRTHARRSQESAKAPPRPPPLWRASLAPAAEPSFAPGRLRVDTRRDAGQPDG